MIRIRTGARIHLGLIAPMAESGRRFGGAGLMLEDPAIELGMEAAEDLVVDGPLAERAREIAEALLGGKGARIEIANAPRDHSGLGTGTQLALSIAAASAALSGKSISVTKLAEKTRRGQRSAIGIHGFERGGFLVDAGTLPDETVAPLTAHVEIPEAWRFVVVLSTATQGLSGHDEHEAFARLHDTPRISRQLRDLIGNSLVPAARDGDAERFGKAMSEYGRKAGEVFRPVQGGVFASARIAAIADAMEELGALGATQSSWGPAVCALAADEDQASFLASRLSEAFGLERAACIVTRARNRGAEVTVDGRNLSVW